MAKKQRVQRKRANPRGNRDIKRAQDRKQRSFDGEFRELCRRHNAKAAYVRVVEIDGDKGVASLQSGGDKEIVEQLDVAIRASAEGRIKPDTPGEGMKRTGTGLYVP